MYTRSEYLSEKCTHQEYYSQFVTDFELEIVKNISLDSPLRTWDLTPISDKSNELLRLARDSYSLSAKVCILKQAKLLTMNQ